MRVARGTLGKMAEFRDQCLLRISGADDVVAARAVLGRVQAVGQELSQSGDSAMSYVSDVMDSPTGPMVLMDAKDVGRSQLQQVLDALVEAAERSGLRSGTLEVPPDDDRLGDALIAVRLAVLGTVRPPIDDASTPRSDRRVPGEWLPVAGRWLRGPGWQPVVVSLAGAVSEIELDSIDEWLDGVRAPLVFVACGSVETGMRVIVAVAGREPRLSFLATGREWGSGGLREEAEEFKGVISSLAATSAYGYVTPVPRARSFGIGDEDLPFRFHPGLGARLLPDELAVDGFWYQVLGPGHLARTGPLPGVEPLAGGRVGLTIGAFDEWVDEVQQEMQSIEPGPLRGHGRALLGACLLDRREARALWKERLRDV